MAGAAKAGMGKSMEACVQMMIVAASERQERNFIVQQQTLQAQQKMFLETLRLQRERDVTRKKESNRKLRFLKSMMSGENGKGID